MSLQACRVELAGDDRIVGITAAMPTGTSLNKFAAVYPERFFDVGIAEQRRHLRRRSGDAGDASRSPRSTRPSCSAPTTRSFMTALQKLPVVFYLDRAGFAGDDGRTHHGIYDLTYLRCVPGMTIMAPKDENELRHMMNTAFTIEGGPIAIRYPRGAGVGVPTDEPMDLLPVGRAETLREGADVAILAVGTMVLRPSGAAICWRPRA